MYIGIDVGGSHIGFGLLNDKFQLIDKKIKLTNDQMTHEDIIRLLIQGIDEIKTSEVRYIGIGFPGKCDLNNQTVTLNKYIGFNDINVIEELRKIYNIPILFENDSNCATIAEKFNGKLRNIENGVLMTVGTGIGLGLIINNQLYRGTNFYAGEIGHAVFNTDNNNWDFFNKNEYENYISLKALKKNAKLKDETIEDIKDIFTSNNLDVKNIYSFWLNNLANCLMQIWYIIDPEKIVLGGGISEIFEYIYEDLMQILRKKVSTIYIEKTFLNNDSGIIGAALLGKGSRFYG